MGDLKKSHTPLKAIQTLPGEAAQPPPAAAFLEEGCSCQKLESGGRRPTAVRAIPRAKPPFRPAGVNTCDDATIRRWERNQFSFPLHQYKEAHLVREPGGRGAGRRDDAVADRPAAPARGPGCRTVLPRVRRP